MRILEVLSVILCRDLAGNILPIPQNNTCGSTYSDNAEYFPIVFVFFTFHYIVLHLIHVHVCVNVFTFGIPMEVDVNTLT